MKLAFRISLISLFIAIGFISFSDQIFAACDGWFSFASNCEVTPPICPTGKCSIDQGVTDLKGLVNGLFTGKPISQYIQDIVKYLLGFVSIIGVIYIIYAGFQLLIGAGDEEKMKKARQIITYVILGIVLMWLAYGIVNWTIKFVTKTASLDIFASETYAYSETQGDTFNIYKDKLQSGIENMESELRVQGTVNQSSIQNVRNLVNEAYIRLPDTPEYASKNDSAKRAVDMYLDLASKNPGSQTHISNAITNVGKFISEAKIGQITGNITATPSGGNAPLTVSFSATNVKDPSGVTPSDNSYIWWFRENGGGRRELGRGPSLTQTFYKEGSYQVFLDVISGSRNSKGRTDVLPLSISQNIEVQPRLGEVVLLVNGVNVSTLSRLKINPTIGKIGILLDATASRAIGNGTIKKTKWDFGNDNVLEYDGSPVIERQLYVNKGTYKVTLEITTNQEQTFKKELQLIVVDPAAVINTDKDVGFMNETFGMSALSYFGNTSNVEYTWQVSEDGSNTGKPLYTQQGNSLTYKFPKVGKYIVSLTSRNPNGDTDTDSKYITIESHDPLINLAAPKSIHTEKPNVIVFDASQSIDPDTNSAKDLSYMWKIDGNEVTLDNLDKGGAIGTYTFTEKGSHTVGLTVANLYGKVATIEKTFDVTSTLSLGVNIVPRAAPIGTIISFQAKAPRAAFYEWNTGDGEPSINGTSDSIEHIYKKTGIYPLTLTVRNADGSETNMIERKVYVTDTNNPFSLIDVTNSSNTIIDDPVVCGDGGAFVVNRSESTTLDGSHSINVDGSTSGISYTWKYLDRIKTGPSISEKFSELGCFPVELTVRSGKNGASHTSKRFIQIKNIVPKLTTISAKVDASKKDSQKVIVTASADGAKDDDGVITSYTWYYTTESDPEPQGVAITQSAQKSFVLPNVTEKYYFGVILEDNDGARINSNDVLRDRVPLIISNDNGNVNMPLIGLKTMKSRVLAGESLDFSVQAKTILGNDITAKSEYAWDFDGDGKIDKKTIEPHTSYTYQNTGNYNMKVKVTYNGASNSKFQNITVKNELKAAVKAYRKGNLISFLNVSQGIYDTAVWQVGEIRSDSLYNLIINADTFSETGTNILTVSSKDNESSSIQLKIGAITDITNASGSVQYQSFPEAANDTIHIKNKSEHILLSLFGNDGATEYTIDTDTKIDSDMDGVPDNDFDNKDTPSFSNGSAYFIDLGDARSKERTIRISLLKNGSVLATKNITVSFDFISDTEASATIVGDISGSGASGFSTAEKANLDKLQEKIRTMSTDDRIVLTQSYNLLIENWDDTFERTKKLIDIQDLVNNSSTLTAPVKEEISKLIDTILVGDAQATDEVTVATKVIESLIPSSSTNHTAIIEKVEAIKSHPDNLTLNKELGKSILEMVKDDAMIDEKYKLMIKSQLQIIVNGGQASVPVETVVEPPSTSGGILGFIAGTVKVFGMILLIIIIIVLIGFVVYRFSRKKDDIGFQDFLIDSIFHSKSSGMESSQGKEIKKEVSPTPQTPSPIAKENYTSGNSTYVEQKPYQDPLATLPKGYNPPSPSENTDPLGSTDSTHLSDTTPAPEQVSSIPDWLKVPTAPATENSANITPQETPFENTSEVPITPTEEKEEVVIPNNNSAVTAEETPPNPSPWNPVENHENEEPSLTLNPTPSSNPAPAEDNLPDWLKGTISSETSNTGEDFFSPSSETLSSKIPTETEVSPIPPQETNEGLPETVAPTNTENTAGLPDWLVNSVQPNTSEPEKSNIFPSLSETPKPKKKPHAQKEKKEVPESEKKEQTPVATNNTSDLPDWLK